MSAVAEPCSVGASPAIPPSTRRRSVTRVSLSVWQSKHPKCPSTPPEYNNLKISTYDKDRSYDPLLSGARCRFCPEPILLPGQDRAKVRSLYSKLRVYP